MIKKRMENENNSDKDLSKRNTYKKNATEAERRFFTKSKILIIETSEEDEKSSMKETNFFRKEAIPRQNPFLRELTIPRNMINQFENARKMLLQK